jgi:hypothetical protein
MDLKAANDQNSRFDVLTRTLMAVCFVATGALLIGTLAFDELKRNSSDHAIFFTSMSVK